MGGSVPTGLRALLTDGEFHLRRPGGGVALADVESTPARPALPEKQLSQWRGAAERNQKCMTKVCSGQRQRRSRQESVSSGGYTDTEPKRLKLSRNSKLEVASVIDAISLTAPVLSIVEAPVLPQRPRSGVKY